ncbi:hypothetical protein RUM44_000621 [Polyplax serrata]|uniref:C2H2-type domain-containing protein n=1 Tax=Polyplax serrata TaxID=468196 RepID=A0ABR1B8V6_POLSC
MTVALSCVQDSADQFNDTLDDSQLEPALESTCIKIQVFDSFDEALNSKLKSEPKNTTIKEKRFFKCDICKKVFNRRFNFERHLIVHSGESLTCHTCGKQYRRQSVLDRHIKVVHQKIRLGNPSCSYCNKIFSSSQSLEDHYRTHTGERPFICEVCGKDFRARPNLVAHKKIHTGELPYSCTLCDYRCRLKSTFVDHCQRHEGTRSCLCSICGKGFVNNYDLKKHKKTHSKERQFACTFCNLTFVMKRRRNCETDPERNQENLSNDLDYCNDEGEDEESGSRSKDDLFESEQDCSQDLNVIPKAWLNIITCKYCGKISCAPKHLRQHEKRGTCTKNFQCDDCGQLFTKEMNLTRHLKRHEKEKLVDKVKRFTCSVCHKKFKFEDNGLAHEKICGKTESTHKCIVCGKRFETKELADQHWTCHHKSCVCHMCGQTFGKPESLKQHVRTVHEELKMVCHYCGKKFSRKARLQEHLQHHTGQMDFTCHVCGKGSTNAYSFGVHLATHSQETPYSCSFCPRTFKHMKYVYLHERSVHLKLKSGKTYVKPKKPGKNVAQRTCPLCNKTFKRESAMLIHKRSVHEGKNGYICKLCGKDFKYTYLLYVHKKKHHFPELCKYVCQFCEKPFPVKTELQNHLRKHTGEKPYICGLCGKTYSFHGSLNMHMKTQHENKKNFKCTVCGSSYNFQSHLTRHMSAHVDKYPVEMLSNV